MSDEKPQDTSEGGIGRSALSGGLERKHFEMWAVKMWGNDAHRHTSNCCGEWDAWQAGVKAEREECAKACDNLAAEVRRMRHRIECLRGGLKSAAGWLLDADDLEGHERCLDMAGDMEPPLMGSNIEVRGPEAASPPEAPSRLPGSALPPSPGD